MKPEMTVARSEDLVRLGRAPRCPSHPDVFMAPLNLPEDPALCQCVKCEAQARFEWIH